MSSVSYGQLVRRNRNFRLYWSGQIVSQLGDWFSAITVQALLLEYTGNAASIAGFMVASLLPSLLLGPIAGVVVDRLPRRSVMIASDLLRAVIALGLLAMHGPETAWIGYACVAALSSCSAFFEPARIATLPNITSDEELVTANALSSVTWSIMLTSGALVGGLVGHFLGTNAAFLLNSLSFVGSALFLLRMQVPDHRDPQRASRGFGDIADGFRYVWAHPEIRWALTAKMGWGVAGGIQTLLPIYGAKLFPLPGDRSGQLSISVLFAAGGLGTALGPVIARKFTGRDPKRIRWAIAISFVVAGIYYGVMALAPNLAATGTLLFLARMHGAIVWVFSTVLLQILVEDAFRGRVFAAETSLFTATMMTSNVVTSQLLDRKVLSAPGITAWLGALSAFVGALWLLGLLRAPAGETTLAAGPAGGGRGAAPERTETQEAALEAD